MATRKRHVGIVGLGYVGRGMERLFRLGGHHVELCDILMPNYEDQKRRINECELAVICVPTPEDADGGCDTSLVEEVCEWLQTPLVLIKSTVNPGFTDSMNENYSYGQNDRFHFSPEYMGEPRNYVAPWRAPDPRAPETHSWVTIGGPNADAVMDFFTPCMANDVKYRLTSNTAAEMAKYMENAYFAMKVTFCNEIAKLCEELGVKYKEVRSLWLLDPRMNGDHTVVFPDKPYFDGKCLPKDLSAIIQLAAEYAVSMPLLTAVRNINDRARGLIADEGEADAA